MNIVTSSSFGAQTLLETLSLLEYNRYHLYFPSPRPITSYLFTTPKVTIPHSRIRFVTIHEHYGDHRRARRSDPYLVPGIAEEPRRAPNYVALFCYVYPVRQRQ